MAISLVLVVRGLSIGMCFMPAMSAAFAAMRPEQISDATPQINVLQRTGGAIGTAVLAVVLQRAGAHAHSPAELASAFDTAYWWALGIAAAVADSLPGAAAGRESAGKPLLATRPAAPMRRSSRSACRERDEPATPRAARQPSSPAQPAQSL